jgi:hypothetical protein
MKREEGRITQGCKRAADPVSEMQEEEKAPFSFVRKIMKEL